jgi:hypothetical protein
MNDPLLHSLVGCALAILFAAAALHKVRQAPRFQAQLAEYRLLPTVLVAPAGWILAVSEAAIALGLLWPDLRPYAGAAAAVLLVAYAGAIAVNLLRGRSYIDCGCGDTPVLLSPWLLARNLVLATGAATLTLTTSDRVLSGADLAIALVSLPALLLAYRAVEQLLENASVLREWRMSRD